MIRVGIDVGGTNTDAVMVEGNRVIAAIKTPTTADVTGGVSKALHGLVAARPADAGSITAVMIGTTHFVNAVIQRRDLNRVAAVRLCLPSCASLPPMVDWPSDLASRVAGGCYLVTGGHEYDGRLLMPLDEMAIAAAARQMRADGIDAAAVTAVFSPLTGEQEMRAADILHDEHPDLRVTLSCQLGRIGLLERENVALLNAGLADLAQHTIAAFGDTLADSGVMAPLYITRNDGTVAGLDSARREPVYSFASGPTNSMRGAAFLSGLDDAMVVDIGGTSSDVGCLASGFPREANNVVEVGGVRTLFRMPDLLSVAVGGGTVVDRVTRTIGPQSVGHQLPDAALVFGGNTLTLTDIAVAAGLADIGDRRRVDLLAPDLVADVVNTIHHRLYEAVDRMKTDAADRPLLAVGGGAVLAPPLMDGVSEVVQVPHHGVANAVGAAIAQVSGEVDHVFHGMRRDDLLREAEAIARERAVGAGARPETLKVVEMEDLPLAYLPGNAVRARVRVVGDIRESAMSGDEQ